MTRAELTDGEAEQLVYYWAGKAERCLGALKRLGRIPTEIELLNARECVERAIIYRELMQNEPGEEVTE